MPEIMLSTNDIVMKFGGLTAVSDLSIEIGKNEIVGLIGPNGAGKTTAFNVITGMYNPTGGKVRYKSKDITGYKPHSITELGIARTFQNIRLFKELTVLENVLVGCHLGINTGIFGATLHLPSYRKREAAAREFSMELLSQVGLGGGCRRKSDELAIWQATEAGNRACPGDQTGDAAPGRTRGRHESPGVLGTHGPHPPTSR